MSNDDYFKSAEIPESLSSLAKISKVQLIEKLTEVPFKNAITNVLLGNNIREFTESLTRIRLLKSYASLLYFYFNALKDDPDITKLANKTRTTLSNNNLSKNEYCVVQWLGGLTGKLSQNLLRDSTDSELDEYIQQLTSNMKLVADESTKNIGTLTGALQLKLEKEEVSLDINWMTLLSLFNTMGAQTLTIRGSEKSLHGKNFEKLILGSVFQLLGLKLVKMGEVHKDRPCFWLSSQDTGEREADATLVSGVNGIRVDIGFIGRGNTEISLDKVSRYIKEMEINGIKYNMDTIIIVDNIGDRSRIDEMAKKINGVILRMSDENWVITLAEHLHQKLKINSDFLNIKTNEDLRKLINVEIDKISISHLLDS